jgi:hypothetical protein
VRQRQKVLQTGRDLGEGLSGAFGEEEKREKVRCRERLGGLLKYYEREAA